MPRHILRELKIGQRIRIISLFQKHALKNHNKSITEMVHHFVLLKQIKMDGNRKKKKGYGKQFPKQKKERKKIHQENETQTNHERSRSSRRKRKTKQQRQVKMRKNNILKNKRIDSGTPPSNRNGWIGTLSCTEITQKEREHCSMI